MTCKVNADTTNGLKLTSDTSGEIDLQTNGTTKVHMDSSGNVGIGTSSPEAFVHLSSNSPRLMLTDTDTGADHRINADSSVGNLAFDADFNSNTSTPSVVFNIKGTERMRIKSDGNVGIGTTGPQSALHVVDAGATPCIFDITGTTGDIVLLRNNGSTKGTISTNGSTVSYNTSSDYRLKENVDYSFDATTRLKELKPCRFNWIADDTNTLLDGFIAHEVSDIVPEAVTGTKDAMETYTDDDGEEQTREKYQGIDQSKLVPLLVKTIQELEARITALENN